MTTTAQFDFETLTLDEVETIELLTGTSIDQLMDAGQAKGKALKAIIFIIKKRADSSYTIEQAGKIPMKEAQALFLGADDPKE